MLKSFFKGRAKPWESDNTQTRLDAINDLSIENTQQAQVLFHLAENDNDKNVRHSAISKLTNEQKLALLTSSSDAAYICAQLDDISSAQLNALNNQQIKSLLSYSNAKPISENLPLLLNKLTSDEKLEILKHSKNQTLANTLLDQCSEHELQELNKAFKQSNKTLYKLSKDKLAQRKAEQLQTEALEKNAQKLLEDIQQLSRKTWHPLYRAQCEHLEKQWQDLAEHSYKQDSNIAFNNALSLCNEKIQENLLQEQQANEAAEKITSLNTTLIATYQGIEQNLQLEKHQASDLETCLNNIQIYTQTYAELKALNDSHTEHQAHHVALKSLAPAMSSVKHSFNDITELLNTPPAQQATHTQLKKYLDNLKKHTSVINWPNKAFKPVSLVSELIEAEKSCKERIRIIEADASGNQNKINAQLRKLKQALEQGHSKDAEKANQKIIQLLKQLPSKEQQTSKKQHQKLEAQVRQLTDWKQYASNPKHEELCVEMEALISADIPSNSRLTSIKNLQQRWKKIEGRASKTIWQRFKTAGDQAFEKCQQSFELKKDVLEHNLEQRKIICNNMDVFIKEQDWDNADWKLVQQQFDDFHKQWKHFFPVNKKAAKNVQERFGALSNTIKEKIKGEWNYNHEQQLKLIEQAQSLIELDAQEAIEKSKLLQARWKNIGVTNRYKSNTHWKQFKKAIDALYEKRRSLKQADFAQQDEAAEKAKQIISAINELCKLDDEQLKTSTESFNNLQADFEELGEFPKNKFKAIKSQYQKACQSYQSHYDGLGSRQSHQQLITLRTLAEKIDALEAGNTIDIADLEKSTESLNQQLKSKVVKRLTDTQNKENKVDDELKLLCIQLEITCDVTSPEHAQAQRMQYQMDQLKQKGLNKALQNPEKEKLNLEIALLTTGPVSAEIRKDMNERIKRALKK